MNSITKPGYKPHRTNADELAKRKTIRVKKKKQKPDMNARTRIRHNEQRITTKDDGAGRTAATALSHGNRPISNCWSTRRFDVDGVVCVRVAAVFTAVTVHDGRQRHNNSLRSHATTRTHIVNRKKAGFFRFCLFFFWSVTFSRSSKPKTQKSDERFRFQRYSVWIIEDGNKINKFNKWLNK